ncbi:ABC transporter substrate-binding protein [Streptomyces sp. NPDC049813]|uniref:ABC transporter substrate-binding protein n=1 Tax=Streptomyces sp. NPDC049813 TaxID=3365597 RepID=UPI003796C4C8
MMFSGRPKEWGPLDWCVALVVVLALTGGVVLWQQTRPGPCGDGMDLRGDDCVGVTERAFDTGDATTDRLVDAVADENARVRRQWEDPQDGAARIPYVRIALMMPFTSDSTSAMTREMIQRGLAGALAAQQQANRAAGPHYQLLLAPDGRDLDRWEELVDRLDALTRDEKAPLVGVTGIPSSTTETKEAVAELSARAIPTVGPVITAASMNSAYFFKTSPNNEQFAEALARYLTAHPEKRRGFLVWDSHEGDVYSQNLRAVFEERFDAAYDLRTNTSHFIGSSGDDQGIPQRFADAAEKICRSRVDTVFFAGRDQDLPAFIDRLAQTGSCDGSWKLRILKIGIGLEPTLSTDAIEHSLDTVHATIVDAAAYDPAWADGKGDPPRGSAAFLTRFQQLAAAHGLGRSALFDGYAAMYYDGFGLLAGAVDRTYREIYEGGPATPAPTRLPTAKDVYSTLTTSTVDKATCSGCLVGASGTYGFTGPGENNQWALCKPVPVVTFPPAPDTAASKRRAPYRTYRGDKAGACPS